MQVIPQLFSRRWCLSLLLAGLALGSSLPSLALQVQAVTGQVTLQRGVSQLEFTVGTRLLQGDQLRSAPGGEVLVRFDDGARLALRSDSEIEIKDLDTLVAAGLPKRMLELIKGGLRYISGQLPASHQVFFSTNSAVVGIRGTDIEIALVTHAVSKTDPGTYLRVNNGAATLKGIDESQVEVRAGHVAFGGQAEFMAKGGISGPAARKLLAPVRGVFSAGQLDVLLR
jgi:hypothetical protein